MRHAQVLLALLVFGALCGCAPKTDSTVSNGTPPATDLVALKAKLTAEGKYTCCIKSPCDFCARTHGNCDCAKDLQKGEGVCSECFGAWKAGQGNVAGVDPATVKQAEHGHDEGDEGGH